MLYRKLLWVQCNQGLQWIPSQEKTLVMSIPIYTMEICTMGVLNLVTIHPNTCSRNEEINQLKSTRGRYISVTKQIETNHDLAIDPKYDSREEYPWHSDSKEIINKHQKILSIIHGGNKMKLLSTNLNLIVDISKEYADLRYWFISSAGIPQEEAWIVTNTAKLIRAVLDREVKAIKA